MRIPLLQPRWSACVSTQVGCALACAFCATGRDEDLRIVHPKLLLLPKDAWEPNEA